jgi:glutathione S-transferase
VTASTSATPTLFQFRYSGSSEKVRRALIHKGVSWDTTEVEWFNREPLERLTSQRLVPVFAHNGAVLGPSSWTVARYVEDHFSGPSLFPGESTAYCFFFNEYAEKCLYHLGVRAFMPYASLLFGYDERMENDVRRLSGVSREQLERTMGDTCRDWLVQLDYLDDHFRDRKFILGDELSFADHAVYSWYWFSVNNPEFRELIEPRIKPRARAWIDRMKAWHFTDIFAATCNTAHCPT